MLRLIRRIILWRMQRKYIASGNTLQYRGESVIGGRADDV